MVQLLGSMKIVVKYPVTVRVDNIGAILMVSNINTTCHTKHVDIRYRYVNEYVEDGVVKLVFVKSADSDSDILTKNLSSELHRKHSKKMIALKKFLASKIFEVKRKDVRDDILTSNILSGVFLRLEFNLTAGQLNQVVVMSVEVSIDS